MSRNRPGKRLRGLIATALFTAAALAATVAPGFAQNRPRGTDAMFEANNAMAGCSRAAGEGDETDRAVAECAEALGYRLSRENRVVTLINSGVIQLRRGDYAASIVFYDEALRLDPDNAIAMFNRGAAHSHAGRYGEAVAALTQSLSLGLTEPQRAYYYRGAARQSLGDARGAREDYESALAIAPGWRTAEQALEALDSGGEAAPPQ